MFRNMSYCLKFRLSSMFDEMERNKSDIRIIQITQVRGYQIFFFYKTKSLCSPGYQRFQEHKEGKYRIYDGKPQAVNRAYLGERVYVCRWGRKGCTTCFLEPTPGHQKSQMSRSVVSRLSVCLLHFCLIFPCYVLIILF